MAETTDPGRRELTQVVAEEVSRRRRGRALMWGALALALVGGAAAVIAFRGRGEPATAERFVAEEVTTGRVVREVSATGHLEARGTVSVGAEISGRIASVEVDYNDRVRKGQVLARFDTTTLSAQDQQAHAGLRVAQTALREAEVAAKQAERDRARIVELFGRGMVSAAERDAAVSAADQATARVASAKAQISLQRASDALADTNLSRAEVRSPIDGVVIRRAVEPGATVAAALQAPELFQLAEDLTKMQVMAAIDEADVGLVKVGQAGRFTVDAFPDETFAGQLTELRNAPQMVQNVVTYEAVLEVDNPDLKLRPGMTASLRIVTAEEPAALKVPNAALRFTPPGLEAARGGARGVFVDDGGSPRFVPLELGISDGAHTAVRGALEAGARVLVAPAPVKGKKG